MDSIDSEWRAIPGKCNAGKSAGTRLAAGIETVIDRA